MGGLLSLAAGNVLLSLVVWAMVRAVDAGSVGRNHFLGLRTQATLSSDTAWERGHRAARPYLQASAIAGIVAVVFAGASFFLLETGEIAGVLIAAIGLGAQVALILWATGVANSTAKAQR